MCSNLPLSSWCANLIGSLQMSNTWCLIFSPRPSDFTLQCSTTKGWDQMLSCFSYQLGFLSKGKLVFHPSTECWSTAFTLTLILFLFSTSVIPQQNVKIYFYKLLVEFWRHWVACGEVNRAVTFFSAGLPWDRSVSFFTFKVMPVFNKLTWTEISSAKLKLLFWNTIMKLLWCTEQSCSIATSNK